MANLLEFRLGQTGHFMTNVRSRPLANIVRAIFNAASRSEVEY